MIERGRTVAIIERKSFDGLLTDMGSIQSLHHQLADLARSERATVVVEAQYGDFLDARRLGGRWPAAFTSRAIAELAAMHATLPIIFAGNRKLANQYAIQFFASCSARLESPQLSLVSEPDPSYHAVPIEQEIRELALSWPGDSFATADIAARFPGTPPRRILRVLGELEAEGLLGRSGRRRGLRWEIRAIAEPGQVN